MTDAEVRLAKRLGVCRFLPASFDKRFAQGLAARTSATQPAISVKESSELLCLKVIKYRRQLPPTLVALAREILNVPPPAPPSVTAAPDASADPASPQLSLPIE